MTHFETNRRTRLIAKVGAAGVVAVVGSALLALPQTVRVRAAGDENVKVTNTSASPVPVIVQGTAGVGGTVQSQQSGAWNVGIAGTPTVVVANNPGFPLLVRDIDNAGRHGYQVSQNILTDAVSGTAIFAVPAGQLAVIQHVSASGGFENAGEVVQAFVRCTNFNAANQFNGADFQEVNHSLVLTPQGENNALGIKFYSASQPISCIASAGDFSNPTLSIHVQTGKINSAQHTWVMAVSGYLVTP